MSKSNKKNIPPLYKYHPIRYAASREAYISEVMNILFRDCFDGAYPIFELPAQTRKEIDTYFYKLIINQIKSSTSKELYPSLIRKMYQMCESCYMLNEQQGTEILGEYFQSYHSNDLITFEDYTAFRFYGSNIFEFPLELLDLFSQTDVDSVLLRDIHLPFSTIYIHFGKQDNIKIYGNICSEIERLKSQEPSNKNQNNIHFLLDGAYISQCPDTGCLRITFTSVKNKHGRDTTNSYGKTSGLHVSTNYIDNYEEIVSLVLEAASDDTSIDKAVELIRKALLKDKTYKISEERNRHNNQPNHRLFKTRYKLRFVFAVLSRGHYRRLPRVGAH